MNKNIHIHVHRAKTKDLGGTYLAIYNSLKSQVPPEYVPVLRYMLEEMDRGEDEKTAFAGRHFGAAQSKVASVLHEYLGI